MSAEKEFDDLVSIVDYYEEKNFSVSSISSNNYVDGVEGEISNEMLEAQIK